VTNGRLAGNQCLDYTINLINDQNKYDDIVTSNYIKANGLTGYTKSPDGLWYKIIKPGTGNAIGINSNLTLNYTISLMNNTADTTHSNATTATLSDFLNLTAGAQEALQMVKGQGAISVVCPSRLAYGTAGITVGTIFVPSNSCLRFEYYNISVTNY